MSSERSAKEDETINPPAEPEDVPVQNDLIIRDGFPALRHPKTKAPITEGDDPIPKHPIAAFHNVLDISSNKTLEDLLQDCSTIFSARTRESDQAYSAGQTYFCPCQMKPRCALEDLALRIFNMHVDGLDGMYIPEESGAEWWTLVMDDEEVVEDDEGDEVGMHFDADYGLEEQVPDMLLHPRLATVTYLSDVGAPTLVLEKRSPDHTDKEKESLKGDVSKGWLCHPQVGTHLCFDGRYLHGAPSTFFPSRRRAEKNRDTEPPPTKQTKRSTLRITFLVNVWLNHCPLEAELLDDDICSSLKTKFGSSDASVAAASSTLDLNSSCLANPVVFEKVTVAPCQEDPAGEEAGVICNREVTIKYNPSMETLHSLSAKGGVLEMEFEKGALTVEVGEKVQPVADETESGTEDNEE